MSTRRSFLQTLGMAATGMALATSVKSSSLWLVPEQLMKYDGPISFEWILAESLAVLASDLPENQFKHRDSSLGMYQGAYQFGIDMQMSTEDMKLSRSEFRKRYIVPAMGCMACEIRDKKPSTCVALQVPKALEFAGRMVNDDHGLDLRFVHAFSPIGHMIPAYDDFGKPKRDADGDLIIESYGPPYFINRFDILIA